MRKIPIIKVYRIKRDIGIILHHTGAFIHHKTTISKYSDRCQVDIFPGTTFFNPLLNKGTRADAVISMGLRSPRFKN